MVENTGYVVEPYIKYPNLLEVLLKFFNTEQSLTTKKEVYDDDDGDGCDDNRDNYDYYFKLYYYF